MNPTRLLLLLFTLLTLGALQHRRLKLAARRCVHTVMRVALSARRRPYAPPPGADPVTLVLAPHPDDDTLGCGGLISRQRLDGARVHVAYVTDGSGSHRGHPTLTPEALTRQREAEARAALRVLGVDSAEITFLGARDGTLDHLAPADSATLTTQLAELLARVRPDEILLPCRRDGSSEHEAAFRLVQAALARSGVTPRLLEFPVWAWWNPVRLVRPLVTSRRVWRADFSGYECLKARAVAKHRSQIEPVAPWTQPAISPTFVSFFKQPVEYYFET